jgi:hypothetical protein
VHCQTGVSIPVPSGRRLKDGSVPWLRTLKVCVKVFNPEDNTTGVPLTKRLLVNMFNGTVDDIAMSWQDI